MKTCKEILFGRRAVRHYLPEAPEPELVQEVLRAGLAAPSAHNLQPWRLIVVQSPQAREMIHPISVQPWFKTVPVYIVVVGNHDQAWHWNDRSYSSVAIDTSIVCTQMWLRATELGLGANWVCAFDQPLCHHLLGLAPNEEPVSIITLGHFDPEWRGREGNPKRKPQEELISYL